jgi:hypothetical protein
MNRGRELLARAGLVIAQYRWSHPAKYTALHKLSQTINEYLEENPQDEPIAYWDTQNGTLIPAVPLSSERTCFEVPLVPLYLHPAPRPEFVRLKDWEIERLMDNSLFTNEIDERQLVDFARAVEDSLVEKNNAF